MSDGIFLVCRTPRVSVTTAAMADMMKDELLSPTASGGEQNTGVVDAPPRCVVIEN